MLKELHDEIINLIFIYGRSCLKSNAYKKHEIFKKFMNEYLSTDDKILMVKYLFYIRDIHDGLGWRDLFRYLISNLIFKIKNDIKYYIQFIPKYGRWDDLICLIPIFHYTNHYDITHMILDIISKQLMEDIDIILNDKRDEQSISTLGKWLPSLKKHGLKDINATHIRKYLGLSEKEYRQLLRILRGKLNIIETKMSRRKYSISFDDLPYTAFLLYYKKLRYIDSEGVYCYLKNLVDSRKSSKRRFNDHFDFDKVYEHLKSSRYEDIDESVKFEYLSDQFKNELRMKIRKLIKEKYYYYSIKG